MTFAEDDPLPLSAFEKGHFPNACALKARLFFKITFVILRFIFLLLQHGVNGP